MTELRTTGDPAALVQRTHWVEVNETHLLQYGTAGDWWIGFRYLAFGRTDRIRIISAGVIGDTVLVACDNREHAEWLREHMLSRGVPKTAAKCRSFRAGDEPASAVEVPLALVVNA